MKIKKFRARNFSEALEAVRKELSAEAVILASEDKGGVRPYVEVTAAVDYDGAVLREARRTDVPEMLPPSAPSSRRSASAPAALTRTEAAGGAAPDGVVGDDIKNEIRSLRAVIEEMRRSGHEISLPAEKKALFGYLRERAFREDLALRACGKVTGPEDLPGLLSADITVWERPRASRAVMVIGPTGVGKTTTVAKLSALSLREGKRVAIITLDTYRIGAVEQMRIYARIMGLPFAAASTVAELRERLAEFLRSRDIVYIDTTGCNPRDTRYLDQLSAVCEVGVPLEVHMLMSASSDDGFMADAAGSYHKVPVDCIGFTKVDEAVRFGPLYNLIVTCRKPVAYLSVGQKVPDDIIFPTVDNVVDLILRKGCYSC